MQITANENMFGDLTIDTACGVEIGDWLFQRLDSDTLPEETWLLASYLQDLHS